MRRFGTALVTAALVLVMAAPAFAGNMAITSFDSLPDTFEAGKPYTLTYSVLQHGVTPVDGDSSLIFTRADDGETMTFDAEPTGEPGRYQVEVLIPSEGNWDWQVTQGEFPPQHMGVLTVEPGAAPSPNPNAAPLAAITAVLVLALLTTALLFTRRSAEPSAPPTRAATQPN